MENVTIDVRLRPIRFGFFVKPDDKRGLLTAFQTSTCLWGGAYNPIIPYFKRVPTWWEREGIRFDNSRQIVNGYLDFFEPDFAVESEKGMAAEFGLPKNRVVDPKNVLPRSEGELHRGIGLDVFSLYRKMYREEFQFVRRHKHRIVQVTAKDRRFELFAACVFGAFPTQRALAYFSKGFREAFEPEQVELDADSLERLYKKDSSSALRIGSAKIEVDFHDRDDPLIFVLDAHEPRDLIDFWNYRAIHRDVLAIPVQWIETLSDFCKSFIRQNHRPLPRNPHGVKIRTTVMFSRSIPKVDIDGLFNKYLRTENPDAAAIQTWYPSIWRPSPEFTSRTTRPTLTAEKKSNSLSINFEDPSVRFDSLAPDFAERFGGDHRWANVISVRDWSFKDRLATVYPTDFRKNTDSRMRLGISLLTSTTEGWIAYPQFKDLGNSWTLLEGSAAIDLWLKEYGIESSMSESGRATDQIIQTLGGFNGVRSLASKGVIQTLDEMSRKPVTRSAHQNAFEQKITKAVAGDHWKDRAFETLVSQKAVDLGYELKCTKCGHWSWYAINQLASSMTCDLCLRTFYFPKTDPSNSKVAKWAYRVIGPFALPHYAAGGYASALTLRFLSRAMGTIDGSVSTWSAGRNLTIPGRANPIEADFILWQQRRRTFGTDMPTDIIFGESKSFGRDAFKDEDIDRLKVLAQRFRGAILVLSTLKEATDLSRDEIRKIRRLAEWGREHDKERRKSRAPVIILTGAELYTSFNLAEEWKRKGGNHAKLVEHPAVSVRLDNPRLMADLTQQLYLGMPSYGEWRQAQWAKRRKKAGHR